MSLAGGHGAGGCPRRRRGQRLLWPAAGASFRLDAAGAALGLTRDDASGGQRLVFGPAPSSASGEVSTRASYQDHRCVRAGLLCVRAAAADARELL